MKHISLYVFCLLCLSSTWTLAQKNKNQIKPELSDDAVKERPMLTPEQYVRLRCSLDGKPVITEWRGQIYSFVPGERQRPLFTFVGMNIGRCIKDKRGIWNFVSRELTYYLDPKTGKVVHRWNNPWLPKGSVDFDVKIAKFSPAKKSKITKILLQKANLKKSQISSFYQRLFFRYNRSPKPLGLHLTKDAAQSLVNSLNQVLTEKASLQPKGKRVPVVHVANTPLRIMFTPRYMKGVVTRSHGKLVLRADVNLTYPNPLGRDPRFQSYRAGNLYQGGEYFLFTVDEKEVMDKKRNAVNHLEISWHRVGQWLPWMKMGKKPGYLVYSARGSKVKTLEGLHPVLQREIKTKMQLYGEAPRCIPKKRNGTSWRYFRDIFPRYKKALKDKNIQFPLAAPAKTEKCK